MGWPWRPPEMSQEARNTDSSGHGTGGLLGRLGVTRGERGNGTSCPVQPGDSSTRGHPPAVCCRQACCCPGTAQGCMPLCTGPGPPRVHPGCSWVTHTKVEDQGQGPCKACPCALHRPSPTALGYQLGEPRGGGGPGARVSGRPRGPGVAQATPSLTGHRLACVQEAEWVLQGPHSWPL